MSWGTTSSVRKLEVLAREEMALEPGRRDDRTPESPPRRRLAVKAPPGVAVLVAEAVDLACKVEGYQICRVAAIGAMAMEGMSGVRQWPDGVQEQPQQCDGGGGGDESAVRRGGVSILGDHGALIRELGRTWEEIRRSREERSGQWNKLSSEFPEAILEGAPADDAPAQQRVVIWSQVQGRLDDELSDLPVVFRMSAAGRL